MVSYTYSTSKCKMPLSLNRTKCVIIGPIFITRWLNDVRILIWCGCGPLEAADEERETDTSKATEYNEDNEDMIQMTACIAIKRAIFDAPQKNRKGGPDFFHFQEITTRP